MIWPSRLVLQKFFWICFIYTPVGYVGVPHYFFEKKSVFEKHPSNQDDPPFNTNLRLLLGGSLCLFCLLMVRLKSIQSKTLTTKMANPALSTFLIVPSNCNCKMMEPPAWRQLPEKYHCLFSWGCWCWKVQRKREGEKNVKMKLKSLLLKKESITGNSCGKVKVVYLQRRMHRGCCCGRGRTLAVPFCRHSLLMMASCRLKHTCLKVFMLARLISAKPFSEGALVSRNRDVGSGMRS